MEQEEYKMTMETDCESKESESPDKEPYFEDELDGMTWMCENGIAIS